MKAKESHFEIKALVAFWLLATVILWPFRHFMTQDDATFARQAILWAGGDFRFATDAMAAALPQTAVAATLIRLFPGVDPLVLMHLLSWAVFLKVLLLFQRWTEWKATRIIALATIPYWLQYGAGFFYDLFAITVLLSLFVLWKERGSRTNAILLGIVSLLGPLELQTLALFNAVFFYWAVSARKTREAYSILIGTSFALGLLSGIPKSIWQLSQAETLRSFHFSVSPFVALSIQYLLGAGFFLLPFVFRKTIWTQKKISTGLGIHLGLTLLLWKTDLPIAAAGVLFTDYLPRLIGAAVATVGIWYWVAYGIPKSRIHGAVLLLLAIAYGFRGFNDLRYAWIALPFLIDTHLTKASKSDPPLALEHWAVLTLLLAVSLFLNSYLLETTAARWNAAAAFEHLGTPKNRISAGYGRDHFELEDDCVHRVYEKLHRPELGTSAFEIRIGRLIPRVYEDAWTPEWIIKPLKLAGFPLSLARNRTAGQESLPVSTIEYRQWGFLPHTLGVYRNLWPVDAWCYR